MSHLHYALLRKGKLWSWTNLPWPPPLLPTGKYMEDESLPLHPIGEADGGWTRLPWPTPLRLTVTEVEAESHSFNPVEQEK